MYTVSVPISVPVTKKKKFYLNINNYRNANHFTLAKAKVEFHKLVSPLLGPIPLMERVDLVYTLFVGSAQLIDTNNVCSVVDKFFSDVLVNCGKLEDDNCHIVKDTTFTYGGIDRENPRVEVTISSHKPKRELIPPSNQRKPIMKISLVQTEIEDAIRDYVNNRLTINEDQRIDIDLKATRGDEGYQAFIDIVANDAPTPVKERGETVAVSLPEPAEPEVAEAAPKKTVSVQKRAARTKKADEPVAEDKSPLEQIREQVQPEPVAEEPMTQEDVQEDAKPSLFETMQSKLQADNTAIVDTTEDMPEAAPQPDLPKRPSLFSNLDAPKN